jgi:adenylate cyclase
MLPTMTSAPDAPDNRNEEFWRDYLTTYDRRQASARRVFNRLPHGPRCRLCAMPFAGPAGSVLRLLGKGASTSNPTVCNSCEKFMRKHRGGAEVDGAMLFADIRGSTALAETMTTGQFHALLDRFYTVAAEVVVSHGGMVDKFVGDELVAVFPPMFSEVPYPLRAIDAARSLLEATGHRDPGGPWVRIGAGVNSGRAWFGVVGEGAYVEMTVLGDVVNTTARLASHAGPGEILVSAVTAQAAHLPADLQRRSLQLKGKLDPVDVVSILVSADPGPPSNK